jgi:YD repeat-containing protein
VSAPESQTKYVGLDGGQAARVDSEVFPEVIDGTDGGPPSLSAGESIVGYAGGNAAQVDLGGGLRGVIESGEPMAVQGSSGGWLPVDLGLSEVGGAFQPVRPAVGVVIPQRLGDGVQIPAVGLSLTPVDGQGSSLGGSGAGTMVGASVFYANTQTDMDTVVKPTTSGFETDTVLRSANSPEQLFFRVGLPEGASLVQSRASGPVEIVMEGRTIAFVRAPSAVDAVGVSVPVSMSVSGDVVVLGVAAGGGQYQRPILVDPELKTVEDTIINESSNWLTHAEKEPLFSHWWGEHTLNLENVGNYGPGEYIYAQYHTEGESKIYDFEAATRSHVQKGRAIFELAYEGTFEVKEIPAEKVPDLIWYPKLCVNVKCVASAPPAGGKGNLAVYKLEASEPDEFNEYSLSGALWNTMVFIAQEKPPVTSFNTVDAKIKVKEPNGQVVERENVFYPGSTGWIGPYSSTAFEVVDKDPGVGVSDVFLGDGSWGGRIPILEEHKCAGIQCNQEYKAQVTYDTVIPGSLERYRLPDGETRVRDYAEDATSLYGESTQTVRVDATPPHAFKLTGLPEGGQLGEGVYKVRAEATDGEGSTPSSGVASLKLGIDGAEAGEPRGLCPRGPCTASAEWTINAGLLGAGSHTLTVVATDNAGNIADESFPVFVHRVTPTAVGPGSLDPESGNFSLGSSDVSMGPGLSVSRSYSSRNLTGGLMGPLGPQWTMSLAGSEGLEEMPDGSMVLNGSGGGQNAFKLNSKGEFESPKSDANLTLSVEEGSQKLPVAYYLKDLKAGTSTKFARPENYLQATPTYYGQMGWEGVGNGQFNTPTGVAVDSKGNVWVTDVKNNRIEEFNHQGEYVRRFGWEGTTVGDVKEPYGVAVDAKGNVWVADTGNNRIEEFNETGEYIREASTGSNSVALKAPHGIVLDAKGDVWVADTGNNRIQEFNENGEPVRQAGPGAGSKELSEPLGVATDSKGNVWSTDAKNHRFVEFNETGGYLNAFGSQGPGNGQFETPVGIGVDGAGDVWVGDSAENRVQEFKSNGEYLTQFGSTGSNGGQFKKPYLLAVDARGLLSIADSENDRVVRWGHSTWLPTVSEGLVASGKVTYAYQTVLVNGRTVIEPTEAVAPHSTQLSCSPVLNRGCRALTFNYASTTTAFGEGASEWGDYKGDLTRVYFHGWDPVSKEMKSVEIAHYAYDIKGRLRAESDPRISSTLRTTYGYDAEGHVTAVSPPEQQPWLLSYGTIPTDTSPGRLISATRPAAPTMFGSGSAPLNSVLPTLSSSTPVVGSQITVSSNGTWGNIPLAYGYQWEDCNASGIDCVSIPGATNFNYTPGNNDVGHTLRSMVTATNSGGSLEVSTAASGIVKGSVPPSYSSSFGVYGTGNGQLREPEGGLATDTSGNVWVSDSENNRIEEFNSKGEYVRAIGGVGTGNGQFGTTEGVTVDSKGNVWATDEGNNRVQEFSSEGVFVRMFGWGVSNGESKFEVCSVSCRAGILGSGNGEFNTPEGIAADSNGNIVVADRGNHRVQEFSPELAWIRNMSQSEEHDGPFYLTVDSNNDIWVAYSWDNKIGEFDSEGKLLRVWGTSGTEPGKLSSPYGVGIGPEGYVWVPEYDNSRVQVFTQAGEYLYGFGSKGNGSGQFNEAPHGIAFTGSSTVYVLDSGIWWENTGNSRIQKWSIPNNEGTIPTPPNPGTSAVTTVEYKVPLSGSGLQNMTATEVGKWGQEDDPVEATAIFPPDEPQGWPASSYKRASVSYFDGEGRLVNMANPLGGIATTEYNEANEAIRTLSPGNRALAIKEGSKSVETAKKLDGESVYNEEDSELLETLGPEHKIKLANGSEVQARHRVKYTYDQGAPAGEAYGLVTETVDSALVAGVENDKRTTITSYSGQGALGWKLRKPTSITVDPTGLKLTTTTIYNRNTGAVVETMTPAGKHESTETQPPSYSSSFGVYGTGNGQLREPEGGLATDASGNVWVSDSENNRIEEFNNKGEYVRAVGGIGTGNGQFGTTEGVTVDSKGNVWATDEGNNRVQEFSSEGVFVRMFGWGVANGENKLQVCSVSCRAGILGSGNGEFNTPEGIATDSNGDIVVADRGNYRVQEFSPELMWIRNMSQPVEHDGPFYLTVDPSNNIWVTYSWDNKIGEFNSEGKLLRTWGTAGSEPGKMSSPYGVGIGPEGFVWVPEYDNNRVQVFTQAGEYLYGFGSKGNGSGQFNEAPHGIAFTGSSTVYVLDSGIWWENTGNSRIQKWIMPNPGSHDAHNKQTIYYTAEANTTYPECGGHVEWEGMPCQTQPAAQPATAKLPSLPVTTVTYNMWGEPETSTETFPAIETYEKTVRTKKLTYDEAGRPVSSEETSTSAADSVLPKVTNAESFGEVCGQTKTVRCVTQSTTEGETTRTVTSIYDTLGRLVKYTDADANTTVYGYEESGDGRLTSISDPKGNQTYAYDPTSGLLTKLVDSVAGTFTASYDIEGNMESETFPYGMTASYTRDQAGETTAINYVKTSHCAGTCPEAWFSETVAPSIHGETLSRANTLTGDSYVYDAAGRLTETGEEPVGKGCTLRIYAYNEDSNRTSLTTRAPGTGGKCATEGGTSETHTYDTADRLNDPSIGYDPLGNTTKLPSSDAGGHELTSSYYVDGQVEKQSQNGQENTYYTDPTGRIRKTIAKGTTNLTSISHYAGSGEALSWRDEGEGKYTRLIPGIDGSLCATQANGGTPVLQLHDLQGDVVGTVPLSETETKLQSTYNSTEFGVPVNGPPPTKYSWLGAAGVASELSSGELISGTVAYQPQLGRPLQTQPVTPPGAAINIAEAQSFTAQLASWYIASSNAAAAKTVIEWGATQKAREKEALQKCREEGGCGAGGEEGEAEGGDPEFGNNWAECKISSSWGKGLNETVSHYASIYGHFECREFVAGFELQLALQRYENGGWVTEVSYDPYSLGKPDVAKETFPLPEADEEHSFQSTSWSCIPGDRYRAWYWGRYWSRGKTSWYAYGIEKRYYKCADIPYG